MPTIAEQCYPGFNFDTWIALVAPAGSPEPVLKRLRDDVLKVVGMKEVKDKLEAAGFETIGGGPDEYFRVVQQDIAKFSRVVREANIKAE